jgi:hypothetical protein
LHIFAGAAVVYDGARVGENFRVVRFVLGLVGWVGHGVFYFLTRELYSRACAIKKQKDGLCERRHDVLRKMRRVFAALKKSLAPLPRNMRDELCIILPNYTPKDKNLVI